MLKQTLKEDLKSSMLSRNAKTTSALRMLLTAIQYEEIQKGGAGYEATDDDIQTVIAREIKKRKESIELYKKGGNQIAADEEQDEIDIFLKYLPEQMSEDEIIRLVDEAVIQAGATSSQDMGKVMGILMPKVKGKADGSLVSEIVKKRLQS